MQIPFKQVDVFTRVPFAGNPVAVVLDGSALDSAQMQRIANWTNLSETTFVLPATRPTADYRVRIFTPRGELPFAGHPTLGTAHALLESGAIRVADGSPGTLVQECAIGLIPLTVYEGADGTREIAFGLPPASSAALNAEQCKTLEDILGAAFLRDPSPRSINVGPTWTIVQMADAQAVLDLQPDFARLAAFDAALRATGVVAFGAHRPGELGAIEARAFAPGQGVDEDPVCGSGNGAVAVFIRDTGQTGTFGARFVSSQGRRVGRSGKLSITIREDGAITVGGESVTCIDGVLVVDDQIQTSRHLQEKLQPTTST